MAVVKSSVVVAVTSRVESFGLTLVEAMAAAVPVVAYDCPNGPREIIEHEKTGLLVPPEDPAALADAVNVLLDDPARAAGMGDAGRIRARAEFSVARMTERTAVAYEEALKARR